MLAPKHMSESYTSFELPLGSDLVLLEKCVNNTGGFRMSLFSSCFRYSSDKEEPDGYRDGEAL